MSGHSREFYKRKWEEFKGTNYGNYIHDQIEASLRSAWADSTQSNMDTAWRQWVVFCKAILQIDPVFPDTGEWVSHGQVMYEDRALGAFCEVRALAQNVKIASIACTASLIRTRHYQKTGRRLGSAAWGTGKEEYTLVLKGLRKQYPDISKPRIAILKKHLRCYFEQLQARSSWSPFYRALYACLTACWQGLCRKSERAIAAVGAAPRAVA